MTTIACVLRSGGEYLPKHVQDLLIGVMRYAPPTVRFICLTDTPKDVDLLGIEAVELTDKWPGWWSKLCLFKPGLLPGPVLYLDLDTIIVRNISELLESHTFTVLENFWAADRIGSGMMAWSSEAAPRLGAIYERFKRSPDRFMKEYVTTPKWGDQGFIRWNSPVVMERWQTKFPGKVVSFKMHVLKQGRIPPEAAVVCFHGRPRPWGLTEEQRSWFAEV